MSLSVQLCEVEAGGLLLTAVLSALCPSTAVLSVLPPAVAWQPLDAAISPAAAAASAELPAVVSSVLEVVYGLMEQDGDAGEEKHTHQCLKLI